VADKRKVVPIADETLTLFDAAQEMADQEKLERPLNVPGLRIGTSAFTAAGWPGSFYPSGLKPKDYLAYYATKFNTVEVDSTFYRTPLASTVNGWYEKTPPDFIFAAKVPQIITHEKILLNCEAEFEEFVNVIDLLDEKLGPLLLQFPWFKETDLNQNEFMTRLRFFLKRLEGTSVRLAVEIRNRSWLNLYFADLLREYNVALVLQDMNYMPGPAQLPFDFVTADFTYARLLGNRKQIEKQTMVWDKIVMDRTSELKSWVGICQETIRRGVETFVYANNHYQGHSPSTVAQFLKLWGAEK
jgi:uncharacterized protein YecE (DUF72 family)